MRAALCAAALLASGCSLQFDAAALLPPTPQNPDPACDSYYAPADGCRQPGDVCWKGDGGPGCEDLGGGLWSCPVNSRGELYATPAGYVPAQCDPYVVPLERRCHSEVRCHP